MLTGLVVGIAGLTSGARPALAACDTPDSTGPVPGGNVMDFTSSSSTGCISETYTGPAAGDTLIVNLDSFPGITEGVFLQDDNSTTAIDGYNIELNMTGIPIDGVTNTLGTAIDIESHGVAPYYSGIASGRPRGDVGFTTGTGGNVTGYDEAVYALGRDVTIVNSGATLNGELNGGYSAIDVNALRDVVIDNNSGTIESDSGSGADPTALVIWVENDNGVPISGLGGSLIGHTMAQTAEIYNGGTIIGTIDLSGTQNTGGTAISGGGAGGVPDLTTLFTNDSNHTWITNGANYFSIGADELDNTSNGLIISQDDTSFNFFNFVPGDDDTVNNDGEFRNELNFSKGTTTNTSFTDLEFFNNTGLINLHGNTAVGDQFALVSQAGGGSGAYTASGSAELEIDSRLGGLSDGATGVPSSSNNVCGYSDCLIVGSSSGTTTVLVKDSVAQTKASYNPSGILVVAGSSALDDFVLDSGSDYYSANHVYETTTASHRSVLDEGLFFYDLLYTPLSHEHRLYGVPDSEAFELPKLETAAQNIWYASSPWLDRQTDLRDELAAGKSVTPGVWAKAIGGWGSRDTTENFGEAGYNYSYNTDYDQNTYGAVAGADAGGTGIFGASDALLAGISGGYVDSNVDFNSPTSATYRGGLGSLYLTYLSDGFYIDMSGKASFMTMDYSAPTLGGYTASPSVRTYGGQVELGQRLGGNLFIEPMMTLAYSNTSIDNFTVLGTKVDFNDAKSARGALGLRLGGTAHLTPTTLFSGSLTGRAWEEVEGKNEVTFKSEGPDLTLKDDFSGAFGEVGGNLSVSGLETGLSGFISGGAKFKSGYTDSNVNVGVRLVF